MAPGITWRQNYGSRTLLSAALGAALKLLIEAGFGDEVRDLKEQLSGRTEKQRQAAFEAAWAKAVESAVMSHCSPCWSMIHSAARS